MRTLTTVTLKTKLLLVFLACAVAPLLVLSVLNYMSGTRAVAAVLREDEVKDLSLMTSRIESTLGAHEQALMNASATPSLVAYVRESRRVRGDANVVTHFDVPGDVRDSFATFFRERRGHVEAVTCFDAGGHALFRMSEGADGVLRVQTEDFVPDNLYFDSRMRDLKQMQVLRSPLTREQYVSGLHVSVPVFDAEPSVMVGALVVEINLGAIFKDIAGIEDAPETAATQSSRRHVVALDKEAGSILYHTHDALIAQPASDAMPFFAAIASRMKAGTSGTEFYDAPDGDRWLVAYGPLHNLGASLSVAENYSAASALARRGGLFGITLALLASLVAVTLVSLIMNRAARRIERVAAGAAAIAGGDLNQHIELQTSGATNALVENFNRMTDRLRELIARETESKQFESFMRLSAMLTHDLKNSITGLSMLVSNMERQFHREEFRADALLSLREVTDKLKRIVARLSEPAKSLSGEYRRTARYTDIVPIIQRVLAMNAEPYSRLYRIETTLPDTLSAPCEPERIEAIIENLVLNALDAMGAGGGVLRVEAGREGEALIFFSVSDTGVGMSDEFIKTKLFRPFATTKSRGLGLGLFTCREIVEAHGGRIDVESKTNAGTRFRVVLPSVLFASGERGAHPSKGTDASG